MHQYLIFFSFWLISLCIMGSRFTHLSSTDLIAFLFMAEYYSIAYMYHNFFIHSSVDGHLGCFYALSIVNSATMNIGIHVSFSLMVFSGYMSSSGIAGHSGLWFHLTKCFENFLIFFTNLLPKFFWLQLTFSCFREPLNHLREKKI